jgi:uncharacterized protein YoxC
MKILIFLSLLFCALTVPALAELTDADLDKIRLIVKEEISEEIKPLKADIDTLKTEGALLKAEVANLKETINNKFDNVNNKFDDIQKNFDRQNNIIIACIGIPLAILAISATVWAS